MASVQRLVEEIRERNARVEADKAWELSKTRRFVIGAFVYGIAVVVFWRIGAPQPAWEALVPTLAYALSTLTFPFLKKWWLKNVYRR